jgi:GTP cyclohydrolase I
MINKILKYANDNIHLNTEEKNRVIENAAAAYGDFLDALKINWREDPNSKDTPTRVAKSFVNDLISGCYTTPPKITAFENINNYDGIVFQGNIDVKSICSHHNLSFIGKAHVAYLPGSKVIGLSKLNRVVEWFSRRPQVQENLTMQIHDYLNEVCEGNGGIAVVISCDHLCACVRGVKHNSTMKTAKVSGAFKNDPAAREEFYDFIKSL